MLLDSARKSKTPTRTKLEVGECQKHHERLASAASHVENNHVMKPKPEQRATNFKGTEIEKRRQSHKPEPAY